jgi:hypothetical protein
MAFDFAAMRGSFFDSAKVLTAVGAAKRKALSKAGAFVRQRSRSSIRRRKKVSPPGKPPSAHKGQIKLIYFGYDEQTGSVVVGPIPFAAKAGTAVVPDLLERGGLTTVKDKRSASGRKARSKKQADAYRQLIKLGRIVPPQRPLRLIAFAARPFMVPAMEAEMPKFAGMFKGELSNG